MVAEESLSNAALVQQLSPAFSSFARGINDQGLPAATTAALPAGVNVTRAGVCWVRLTFKEAGSFY
jgi:hypothetical protein